MILGESHILIGDKNKGTKLIKEGWVTADLSKNELKYFRKKYKKYLNADDYIKRADYFCLLYTSPSPRDISGSRMPSSA